ncbi:MAG: hypothetical protein M0Q49_09345 [Porticoccaceae bacterium]|nr:hypothetical protein [Porticoccaceae bacterium]
MATLEEQIALAKKKQEAIREKQEKEARRIKQLEARLTDRKTKELREYIKASRTEDTRRKILIGAMVLGQMQANEELNQRIRQQLDSYLQRDDERSLFQLPPIAKPTTT